MDIIQRVGKDCGHIASALGKAGGTTEIYASATDSDLWQAERSVDSVLNAKAGGVLVRIGVKCDVNAVEAKANFIDEIRGEGLIDAEGRDLALGFARVTEVREAVTLQSRFLAQVVLPCIIAVQPHVGSQVVAHISSPLINVHRRSGRAEESATRGVIR